MVPAVPLDDETVYARTRAGQDEVLFGLHALGHEQRHLLLLVNGYTGLRRLIDLCPSVQDMRPRRCRPGGVRPHRADESGVAGPPPSTIEIGPRAKPPQGASAGGLTRGIVWPEATSRFVPCCTSNATAKVSTLLGLATVSTYHHSATTRCGVTSSSM
jgi:hypothetical protein